MASLQVCGRLAATIKPALSSSPAIVQNVNLAAAFKCEQRTPLSASSRRSREFAVHANSGKEEDIEASADDAQTQGGEASREQELANLAKEILQKKQSQSAQQQSLSLEDVNPVGLGRKSRQFVDDVWQRIIELGQLARPQERVDTDFEFDAISGGPYKEFDIPSAQFTTVLVVGATGRVGRVVVRKLLLRGYTVKALVRNNDPETLEKVPRACEVVVADLGDEASLQKAVVGCNKIIFCATARTSVTVDLQRVDNQGVVNLSKAFLDYNHRLAQKRAGRSSKSKALVLRLSKPAHGEGWELGEGRTVKDDIDLRYDGGMDVEFEVNEDGQGVFSGYVFTRGGFVECSKQISLPDGMSFSRFDGLVLRLVGDGKAYSIILRTRKRPAATVVEGEGEGDGSEATAAEDYPVYEYGARMATRKGANNLRVPFSAFRPLESDAPPFNPHDIDSITFRFEQRRPRVAAGPASMRAPTAAAAAGGGGGGGEDAADPNSFKLAISFVKAFPAGEETDFILVSCSGAGVPEDVRDKVVKAKLSGENHLRNCGLGYTIVRPGPLVEEPGGGSALVFDQGNRITQGISCADVADVCVKALHEPSARNKSFDVCYEYTDSNALYELVAHLPDKATNYLTPALAVLEKNT